MDTYESKRRSQSTRKQSSIHPYAAIEHRVIDSHAFADLKPMSKVLLLLIARQLTKDNNGHLQASFTYCWKYGIGSEHTLRGAIDELISHGFLYRTRSHGANKAWAKYAVTWLPITQKENLFLAGFKSCAWRDWDKKYLSNLEENKKSTPQKMPEQSGKKCSFTADIPAESAGSWGAKSADYELIPCVPAFNALTREAHNIIHFPKKRAHWAPVSNIG